MEEENTSRCSVCGLPSNQMGPCPACGSEIQNPNRINAVIDYNEPILLNYGIKFSPKIEKSENIPYGIDFAPAN